MFACKPVLFVALVLAHLATGVLGDAEQSCTNQQTTGGEDLEDFSTIQVDKIAIASSAEQAHRRIGEFADRHLTAASISSALTCDAQLYHEYDAWEGTWNSTETPYPFQSPCPGAVGSKCVSTYISRYGLGCEGPGKPAGYIPMCVGSIAHDVCCHDYLAKGGDVSDTEHCNSHTVIDISDAALLNMNTSLACALEWHKTIANMREQRFWCVKFNDTWDSTCWHTTDQATLDNSHFESVDSYCNSTYNPKDDWSYEFYDKDDNSYPARSAQLTDNHLLHKHVRCNQEIAQFKFTSDDRPKVKTLKLDTETNSYLEEDQNFCAPGGTRLDCYECQTCAAGECTGKSSKQGDAAFCCTGTFESIESFSPLIGLIKTWGVCSSPSQI